MTMETLFEELKRVNRQLEDLRQQTDVQMMSAKQIGEKVGVTEKTVWCWVDEGKFPKPDFKISHKVTRWKLSTLAKWQAEKANSAA